MKPGRGNRKPRVGRDGDRVGVGPGDPELVTVTLPKDERRAKPTGKLLPAYFPILLAMLLGYMLLTQWMKDHYARRYGWQ